MDFNEEEYSSVSWDTSATDLKPDVLSDEESTPPQGRHSSASEFNELDESVYSNVAASNILQNSNFGPDMDTPEDESLQPYLLSVEVPTAFPMTITVTDPLKELDGTKDAFISYLITTKTTSDTFIAPTVTVRRRFQDFVWLHNALSRDFAACVVPPLPDKHRMEYITGDRFAPEFVEKRRASLQRLLQRLGRHPTLQKSEYFRIFLESREWVYKGENAESLYRQKRGDGVFENLGDALLNAFSKIKKPDVRFIEIKEHVDKLEENIETVDRLYQKILKRQTGKFKRYLLNLFLGWFANFIFSILTDLEADYTEFGSSIAGLGALETGITDSLEKFGTTIVKFSEAWKQMTEREEHEYLTQTREFLSYCRCVKVGQNVLKLRDQKQVDFEALSDYLQNAITERENLVSTGKSSTGFSAFVREKVDNIKGVDQERAKQERLARLDAKISELKEEVEGSNDISNSFSGEVAKEYEIFQGAKAVELKESLLSYTDSHVEFYRKGINLWEEIIPMLEDIKVQV
ncbi:hypothetical protein G9A89_019270 [Geosiphon pyriformis]|nr:hypothetical protein G9A89_019270 [Geosiphon pyriformis]